MPRSLFLKSLGFATTISNPEGLTFDRFCRERGLEDREPCSMESFSEYGVWLQKQLVRDVEPLDVTLIERANETFRVTVSSGERIEARRVVVAIGLRYFQRVPPALAQLPSALVTHTAQHSGYQEFRDKRVCVIGAGQSALEAAVLLREAGAQVELLVRGPGPVFHGRTPRDRSIFARLRKPLTVLGEGRLSWTLEHFPLWPHFLPDDIRVRFARKYLGPAGSWWLRPRFEGKVPIRAGCQVISARTDGGGVVLRVREGHRDERDIRADHVVCGTGFELDIGRIPFLDPDLRSRIARIERAPRLDRHFQSSVPGLHFVGVSSTFSFGPLFRFVAGTAYTAPVLARYLARTADRARVPQFAVSA
jgi:FAD-dependent urate hydroxylase